MHVDLLFHHRGYLGYQPTLAASKHSAQAPLNLLDYAPKVQIMSRKQGAGKSDKPKKSCKVLPLSGKMKVLDLMRKYIIVYGGCSDMYVKNKSSNTEV